MKFIYGFIGLLCLLAVTGQSPELKAQSVTNLFPANAETCVSLQENLFWSVSGGTAVRFHLMVDESSSFTSPVVDEDFLTDTTFTLDLSNNDTKFYWKVSATFSNNATAESEIWSFTTVKAPPVPVSPVDEECIAKNTEFEWVAVQEAQSYSIQVATSSSFTNIIASATDLSGTTHTILMPNYNVEYYWRVRAEISGNCLTEWSDPVKFKVNKRPPDLQYPADNAVGVGFDFKFAWNVATANEYSLQVADNPDFTGTLEYDAAGITSKTFSATFSEYNKDYYWRARATYDDCQTEWSATRHFRTQYRQVELKKPDSGDECVELTSRYSWVELANPSAYRLQIALDPDFDSVVVDRDNIESPSAQATITDPITVHWWRVRANDEDNFGIWSESRSFTSSLDDPMLLFPTDGLAGLDLNLKLKWQEDMPGSTYNVQVSPKNDFTDLVVNETDVTDPELEIELSENNTEYFWRVQAIYSDCSSSWSVPSSFITIVGPPDLVEPTDNAIKVSLKPVFFWKKASGALAYEINIAEDKDFNVILRGQKGISATAYQFGIPFEVGTDYWWHVRSTNEYGTSVWSEAFKFSTGGQGAEVPVLIYPDDEGIKVPVDPVLVWKNSARADSYHVQVSKSAYFMGFAFNDATVTDTSVQVTGLDYYERYYWRVAAVNDSGTSTWSEVRQFRTTALIPDESPVLRTPDNNLTDVSKDPKFSWFLVPRAEGYHLQVATENNFRQTSLVFDDDKVWKVQKMVFDLPINTSYFWRVLGWNEAGDGPWSEIWTFTVKDGVSVFETGAAPFESSISPNPFSEKAMIKFTLPKAGNVEINVYNTIGSKVAVLADRFFNAGENNIEWMLQLQNGLYMYEIISGGAREVRQMVIIR